MLTLRQHLDTGQAADLAVDRMSRAAPLVRRCRCTRSIRRASGCEPLDGPRRPARNSGSSPLWNLDIPKIRYDTARARELLAAEGWGDSDGDGIIDRGGRPLTFELIVPSSSMPRRQGAIIMERQLRQIGIDMRIREVEMTSHSDQTQAGRFDASYMGFSQDPKPLNSLVGLWGSDGANNYGQYTNPRFDSLLAATASGTDADQTRRTWIGALGVIQSDWPAVWMVAPSIVSAVHIRFENVVVRPDQNWGATIWRWRVRPDQMLPRDRVGIQ